MDRVAAAAAIEAFLRAIGHAPATSPALEGTGQRVADLYVDDLLDGYAMDVDTILAGRIPAPVIPAPVGQQVVAMHAIETHVVCPHHLTVARGFAAIAFVPGEHVVGLGALARLVDAHAHRLALQEDVGLAIAHDLVERLGARAAGCVLELSHGCLAHHGPKKAAALVRTISLAGEDPRGLVLAALVSGNLQAP